MYRTSFLIAIITGFVTFSCNTTKRSETTNNGNRSTGQEGSAHNSRNSIDWTGIYSGILPCADCEGILTELRLHEDLTYEVTSMYAGKVENIYRSIGHFKWDETGNKIILDKTGDHLIGAEQYQVGENTLIVLDKDGEKIQNSHPESLILKKVLFDNIVTEKYWRLIELNGKKFVLPEKQQREPHFILKNEDNRIIGFAGCNSFNGAYEILTGDRIRFSKIVTTLMACLGENNEKEFLRVFDMADNYSLKGDTLSLNKAKMAPMARFTVVYLK